MKNPRSKSKVKLAREDYLEDSFKKSKPSPIGYESESSGASPVRGDNEKKRVSEEREINDTTDIGVTNHSSSIPIEKNRPKNIFH